MGGMGHDDDLPVALLVEDDEALATVMRYHLEEQGFRVVAAGDGPEALDRFADSPPQIVLLDWMLPTLSGLQVCRRIRQDSRGQVVPIIIVTARSDKHDVVEALDAGADDFVTKPFSFANLAARMQSLLRRAQRLPVPARLTHGDIVMDLANHRVSRGGEPVQLGPTEFRLLQFLMSHPGRVFARDEVIDALWGPRANIEPRTLDVHVGRLRKALGDDAAPGLIRTVRGAGYVLDEATG